MGNDVLLRAQGTFAGLSLVSKVLCGVLVLFHLLSYSSAAYGVLALEPGSTVPPRARIWTLVTGGLIEGFLPLVLVDLAVVVFFDRTCEPLWGQLEFARFVGICNVVAVTASSATYLVLYGFTGSLDYLFFYTSGFTAVPVALCVAYKQLYPQHTVQLPGLRLPCRFIPGCAVLFYTVLALVGVLGNSHILFAVYGLLASWVYLRFYQRREGSKGDVSEAFAFTDFFPAFLQPLVQFLGTRVFSALVLCRVCSTKQQYDLSSSTLRSRAEDTDADSERRRNLALKALQDRMKSSKPGAAELSAAPGVGASVTPTSTSAKAAPSAAAAAAAPAKTTTAGAPNAGGSSVAASTAGKGQSVPLGSATVIEMDSFEDEAFDVDRRDSD
eukprot:m.71579 g.71579  ORF g.71579 m.71579 type:complete len:384 (-) comp16910_c0_seq3:59-1210(-)